MHVCAQVIVVGRVRVNMEKSALHLVHVVVLMWCERPSFFPNISNYRHFLCLHKRLYMCVEGKSG